MKRPLTLGLLASCLFVSALSAGSLTLVTSRGALGSNDSVDWSVLGPAGTLVPSGTSLLSVGGMTITLSQFGSPGTANRQDQSGGGSPWDGDFAVGDALLASGGDGQFIAFSSFSSAVKGVGFQIQDFHFGFKADFTLEALGVGDVSFGTVGITVLGPDNNQLHDGSAPFLGVTSSSADIVKIFIISSTSEGANDFAINKMDMITVPSGPVIPEPATLLLLSSGLAGGWIRRKFRKS